MWRRVRPSVSTGQPWEGAPSRGGGASSSRLGSLGGGGSGGLLSAVAVALNVSSVPTTGVAASAVMWESVSPHAPRVTDTPPMGG